jgi:predicted NAD-dependent protein-ADP-ribosyltransferase YbiA (DUF1768 family)
MATGTVRVTGLRELNRAFKKISGDLDKEMKKSLIKAAEPVKVRAEALALGRIRNMPRSPRWADMRIGVTQKGVYMVPFARNRGGSGRSNLKSLLLDRSMDPALEEKQNEVVEGVGEMIDYLSRSNGF